MLNTTVIICCLVQVPEPIVWVRRTLQCLQMRFIIFTVHELLFVLVWKGTNYLFLINLELHTHIHTPACKRLQTRTTGMDPPTEDSQFLIHHYSTVDIMWLFTTQPRTSSYTPNRGHGLNSIFTSFLSSCTPPHPRTEDRPRCGMCPRSIVKFLVCVLVWRRLQTLISTGTFILGAHSSKSDPQRKNKEI